MKKKSKDILHLYTVAPLDYKLLFFFASDLTTFHKHLNLDKNSKTKRWFDKKIKDEELIIEKNDTGLTFINKHEQPVCIMVKRAKDSNEVLLHEIIHVVQQYESYCHINNEPEFRAYLITNMYRDLKNNIVK